MMGVYLLTHKDSGKCYVGQSRDVVARIKSHRKNSFPKEHFYDDVLEECSIDLLIEREAHWIVQLETRNPSKGYNKIVGHKPRKEKTYQELRAAHTKWLAERAK